MVLVIIQMLPHAPDHEGGLSRAALLAFAGTNISITVEGEHHLGAAIGSKTYTEQSRAEQSRAEQSRAEQSRAEQSRAEQSRAEQSRAEQSRAEQSRAEQSSISQPRSSHRFRRLSNLLT